MDNDGVFDWPPDQPPYDHYAANLPIYRRTYDGTPGSWGWPFPFCYTADNGSYQVLVYPEDSTDIGFIEYQTPFNRADNISYEMGISDWMESSISVIGHFESGENHSANIRMWAYQ
jgi:hypothetical protein